MKIRTLLFITFLGVLPLSATIAQQGETLPKTDPTTQAEKPVEQPTNPSTPVGPPAPAPEQKTEPTPKEQKATPFETTTANAPKTAKTQLAPTKPKKTEGEVSTGSVRNEKKDTVKRILEIDTSSIRVKQLKKEQLDARARLLKYEETQEKNKEQLSKLWDYLLFGGLFTAALFCIFLLWHLKKVENLRKKVSVPVPSERRPAQSANALLETRPNFIAPSAQVPLNATSLYCELLMGAGPRKNLNVENDDDYEMGEDVAGFISQAGRVVFWIMDGTSDSDEVILPKVYHTFFSSRLLAQTLGWKIREAIIRSPKDAGSTLLLVEALKATQAEWDKSLSTLTPESTDYLKNLLLQRHALYCSTTVLMGILDTSGNLSISRIGDSGFVVYHSALTIAPAPKSDRQFASLILDKNNEPALKFSPLQPETIESFRFSNAHSLLAFSDGIAPSTAQWLSQFNKPDFGEPLIRRKLLQLKSHSGDDKSLFLVQIK